MNLNDQQLDDLFRDALGSYSRKPSKAVWKGIEETIGSNTSVAIIRRPLFWWSAAASIALISGLLYLIKSDAISQRNQTKTDDSIALNSAIQSSTTNSTYVSTADDFVNKENKTQQDISSAIVAPETNPDTSTENIQIEKSYTEPQHVVTTTKNTLFNKPISITVDKQNNLQNNNMPSLADAQSSNQTFQEQSNAKLDITTQITGSTDAPKAQLLTPQYSNIPRHIDINSIELTQPLVRFIKKDKATKKYIAEYHHNLFKSYPASVWELGLHYNSEQVYYPNNVYPTTNAHSIDMSVHYKKGTFSFITGTGITITSDDGGYAIDYKAYEKVGEYDDVYGVKIDTTDHGVEITYLSNQVDVFDSVAHTSQHTFKREYTYLHIPAMVGYNFNVLPKLNCTLQGGPLLSIMIQDNMPNIQNVKEGQITDFNAVPDRIKTNWQLQLGLALAYQINHRISVAIEPNFRYYLDKVYEQEYIGNKHPYTFGVRAGLQMQIN